MSNATKIAFTILHLSVMAILVVVFDGIPIVFFLYAVGLACWHYLIYLLSKT